MSEADTADYSVEDISEQTRIREVDRLYDHLDDNVSFFSTLREATVFLAGMQDPSTQNYLKKLIVYPAKMLTNGKEAPPTGLWQMLITTIPKGKNKFCR